MAVDRIRESFAIDGVLPLTLRDVETRLASLKDDLMVAFKSQTLRGAVDSETSVTSCCVASHDQNCWKTWSWNDGKLSHSVPHGWNFPTRLSVKSMWDLWHFGDKSTGIRPYKMISRQHDIQSLQHMRHHRVASVMKALDALIPHNMGSLSELLTHEVDAIFKQAFSALVDKLYSKQKNKRAEEMTCGTLYNRLCAFRKARASS
ncbi:hypothetical protein AC1031_006925 [Aphanomyces cochlioides]|nr:hypothetical protein AC1031_006925 [Aphanomyces cochlioides]